MYLTIHLVGHFYTQFRFSFSVSVSFRCELKWQIISVMMKTERDNKRNTELNYGYE